MNSNYDNFYLWETIYRTLFWDRKREKLFFRNFCFINNGIFRKFRKINRVPTK